MRIGLIGATGWLGSALGKGLLSRRIVAPGDLALLNRSGPRGAYHGHADVIWASDAADLVAQSDLVVISVRPADWPGLALRAGGRLVLSFMAGIPSGELARCGGRIVRAMPNAAAEIGASYSPWWAAPGTTAADDAAVALVLSAIGTSDRLDDEAQIDLMAAVSGSGAAYPALMVVAMADYLRARGVGERIAWRAAEAAVCGGARVLEASNATADQVSAAPEVLAAYKDYRGITAAGLDAAGAVGFGHAMTAALEAAVAKARDGAARS